LIREKKRKKSDFFFLFFVIKRIEREKKREKVINECNAGIIHQITTTKKNVLLFSFL
jgi:hypothetical protein